MNIIVGRINKEGIARLYVDGKPIEIKALIFTEREVDKLFELNNQK